LSKSHDWNQLIILCWYLSSFAFPSSRKLSIGFNCSILFMFCVGGGESDGVNDECVVFKICFVEWFMIKFIDKWLYII